LSLPICSETFCRRELAAGLIGGLGLAPGANVGVGAAVFEAVHGSAPDIAGKNLANPSAIILAAAMMRDYLGEVDAAREIEAGVAAVIKEGQKVTRDLNPERYVESTEMTQAIFEKLYR